MDLGAGVMSYQHLANCWVGDECSVETMTVAVAHAAATVVVVYIAAAENRPSSGLLRDIFPPFTVRAA